LKVFKIRNPIQIANFFCQVYDQSSKTHDGSSSLFVIVGDQTSRPMQRTYWSRIALTEHSSHFTSIVAFRDRFVDHQEKNRNPNAKMPLVKTLTIEKKQKTNQLWTTLKIADKSKFPRFMTTNPFPRF